MTKILLTGATGFLGNHIYKDLSQSNKIITISRSGADINIDLSKNIINFPDVDLVIHCAGKAHSIPKTELDNQEFFEVNVKGTENLLKSLEFCHILPKYFVFISSVSVYGKEFGIAINEDFPLGAKDPYGISKIEAEAMVTKWCKKNNVICTILRLPLLVGKNPPGNLGAMLKAIDKGYYFNIGGGLAKKSMVLSKDVASFIPIVATVGGIYNLTDGYHPNFDELSLAISKKNKKLLNLPFFLAKILAKLGDCLGDKVPFNSFKLHKITSNLTFDDAKARNTLNWKPESVIHYLKSNSI